MLAIPTHSPLTLTSSDPDTWHVLHHAIPALLTPGAWRMLRRDCWLASSCTAPMSLPTCRSSRRGAGRSSWPTWRGARLHAACAARRCTCFRWPWRARRADPGLGRGSPARAGRPGTLPKSFRPENHPKTSLGAMLYETAAEKEDTPGLSSAWLWEEGRATWQNDREGLHLGAPWAIQGKTV